MDYFTQQKQYLKRTTLRRLKIPLRSICSKKGPHYCLGAKREQDSCQRQVTINLFFTSWVSLVIPTWAVLRSMANARKCQLEDFCEKKWETHTFCTRNMGAHVRSTSAKKLVSSDFAKILNVATKIRETCEETLFTPSSPVKATKLYHFCLSDKRSPKSPINV